MRTPHKGHFGENSLGTLERRWEVLVMMREEEIDSRRFDNTQGIRKHRQSKLFNERHGLSTLFCSGFHARYRIMRQNRLQWVSRRFDIKPEFRPVVG